MNKEKNILICKSVIFYSPKDEDAFFEWIKKINCIKSTSTARDELSLHISNDAISDEDLDDLLALFHRYKINMKQLGRFLNEDNKQWFYENRKAFWHKKVFGA